MKAGLIRLTACALSLLVLAAAAYPPWASAQPAPQDSQAPTYLPQQLDQLLAPIALYPDPLLAQILMASTYPLEVVEAARWINDSRNGSLRGDQLSMALQQQTWDPGVKSLVPFPQILQMMNTKLEWTQALGNAFLAQQAAVMDSVQRLRFAAQAAGTLRSTPQQTVLIQGSAITIEPADPRLAYVPYYDPRAVYGSWGYPNYPPVYFPPPPNYGYVAGPGIFFGIGFGVIGALWGWDRWDWGHHDIHIDVDRYNGINSYAISHDNRPRYTENSWRHDPAQRRGVPYGDPGLRQKFQPTSAGPAYAHRDFRGFDNRSGVVGTHNPGGASQPANTRTVTPPTQRPPSTAMAPGTPRPAVQRPVAPAFSSFGRGPDARAQSQRGEASRQSMPPAAPPRATVAPPPQAAVAPQHSEPAGGGQKGGGNDKRR